MRKFLFIKTINTKRLTDVTDTDNQDWQDNLSGIKCSLQVGDDSFSEDLAGSYGKDCVLYTDICDMKVGDKVIDGTDEYLITGVRSYTVTIYSIMEVKLRQCQ